MPTLIVEALVYYFAINVVVAYAIAFAVIAVAIYALTPKAKQPSAMSEAVGRMQMVRSTVEPRRVVIGRVRVSGVLVYAVATGSDNSLLHLVIVLASHRCTNIGAIYFNDVVVGTIDGNGNVVDGIFSGRARIKKYLGEPGQVADPELMSEDPSHWTSAHRGDGICYLYVRLSWDQQTFPMGVPNISAVVDGKMLFDPRTSATNWSQNWALAVRDYLTSDYGLRCTTDELDETSFAAAANISDEIVTLQGGGSEFRYRCNGSYTMAMRRDEIMQGLLSAGLGQLTYSQGKYRLVAGAYRTPVGTLTESDLAGEIKMRVHVERGSLYNAVRGVFIDPNRAYQPVDFPPITDATYQSIDGEQIFKDIDLPYTQTASMAQRIAKIWNVRSCYTTVVTATWKPKCF